MIVTSVMEELSNGNFVMEKVENPGRFLKNYR